MSAPAWLERVLNDRAFVDLGTVAGRAVMAEAILNAIPKHVVATAIRESAAAVLLVAFPTAAESMRADVARELGNNAAMTVLLALEEP